MTTNITFLRETLVRRIARGKASSNDLPLLLQLLACQRRKDFLIGTSAGVGLAILPLALSLIIR